MSNKDHQCGCDDASEVHRLQGKKVYHIAVGATATDAGALMQLSGVIRDLYFSHMERCDFMDYNDRVPTVKCKRCVLFITLREIIRESKVEESHAKTVTSTEISAMTGVSPSAVSNWKQRDPSFPKPYIGRRYLLLHIQRWAEIRRINLKERHID